MDPNKNIKTACLILLPIILALGYAYFKKQKVQSDYFLIEIKQLEYFSKQVCIEASTFQQQENLLRLINTIESQKGEFKNQLKSDSITLIENLKTLYRSYQSQTTTAQYIDQLQQRLSDCPAEISGLQFKIQSSSSRIEEQIREIQERIKIQIIELNTLEQNKNHNQANILAFQAEIKRIQNKKTHYNQLQQRSPSDLDIPKIEEKIRKLKNDKVLIQAEIFQVNKTLDIELRNQSISISQQISILSDLDSAYKRIQQDIITFNLDMSKTFYIFQKENMEILQNRTTNLENLKSREQQEDKLNDIKRLLLEVQVIRQNFQEYFDNFNLRYYEAFQRKAHNETLQSLQYQMDEANILKKQYQENLKNVKIEIEIQNSKRNKLREDAETNSKEIIDEEIKLQMSRNQQQQSVPTLVDEQPTIDQYQLKIYELERIQREQDDKIQEKQQKISWDSTSLNQKEQELRNIKSELKLLDQQLTQKIIDCLRARKKHKELADKLSQSNINRNQMKDNIRRIIVQLKQNIDSKTSYRGYPTDP